MRREVHARGLRWLSETADMDVHATERSEDVTKLSHKLNEKRGGPGTSPSSAVLCELWIV